MTASGLTIGQCASLACLLEATAGKPGNVHRGADFEDVTYLDFATSAVVIAPAFEAAAAGARLGETVLAAVAATRAAVGTNTNLGTILLLAPLAMTPETAPLAEGVARVVAGLNADDARLVYRAIGLAEPGGLGQVDQADVRGKPPENLLAAMRLAAERDLVAKQYVNQFAEVLGKVVPWLDDGQRQGWRLSDTIVATHLRLMSEFPDSLIRRKCGDETAQRAATGATVALAAGKPGDDGYHRAVADLDFWLRADGHRRNPGTSADLVAAGLFAALRDGIIRLPIRFY
ncbi:MAG TPA: triphosphoribosyl-dephospho-CoA synthase [Pirellulales bacterium]|nr:triphosphoribosyl-dephospho-CoA synthase [Pirellulales bacterium]